MYGTTFRCVSDCEIWKRVMGESELNLKSIATNIVSNIIRVCYDKLSEMSSEIPELAYFTQNLNNSSKFKIYFLFFIKRMNE